MGLEVVGQAPRGLNGRERSERGRAGQMSKQRSSLATRTGKARRGATTSPRSTAVIEKSYLNKLEFEKKGRKLELKQDPKKFANIIELENNKKKS